MISELTLDDSYTGYNMSFRFGRNKNEENGGRILLYVREDIPAKILSHYFSSVESFFVEIIL